MHPSLLSKLIQLLWLACLLTFSLFSICLQFTCSLLKYYTNNMHSIRKITSTPILTEICKREKYKHKIQIAMKEVLCCWCINLEKCISITRKTISKGKSFLKLIYTIIHISKQEPSMQIPFQVWQEYRFSKWVLFFEKQYDLWKFDLFECTKKSICKKGGKCHYEEVIYF